PFHLLTFSSSSARDVSIEEESSSGIDNPPVSNTGKSEPLPAPAPEPAPSLNPPKLSAVCCCSTFSWSNGASAPLASFPAFFISLASFPCDLLALSAAPPALLVLSATEFIADVALPAPNWTPNKIDTICASLLQKTTSASITRRI